MPRSEVQLRGQRAALARLLLTLEAGELPTVDAVHAWLDEQLEDIDALLGQVPEPPEASRVRMPCPGRLT